MVHIGTLEITALSENKGSLVQYPAVHQTQKSPSLLIL